MATMLAEDQQAALPSQASSKRGRPPTPHRHLWIMGSMIGCRVLIPVGAFANFLEAKKVRPCPDATKDRDSVGSKNALASTSSGPSAAAAASARLARRTANRLKSISRPERPEPKDRWLSRKEAAAVIRAARTPQARLYLPHFILIGLYTGRRKEAILSLRWPQVNLEARTRDTVARVWPSSSGLPAAGSREHRQASAECPLRAKSGQTGWRVLSPLCAHVWTAPAVQEENLTFPRIVRVQPCIQRSPYGDSSPGAGAVHHINSDRTHRSKTPSSFDHLVGAQEERFGNG